MTNYFSPSLLKGRAALVTGGGTGICRGIALALAHAGCDVAITSRSEEHLQPTVAELRDTGVRATAVAGDVRKPADVDAVLARTVEAFGRLDVLVNGAAGNFVCLAENLSPNGFGTVVDIDLKGTFNVSRAAFPFLKKQGGAMKLVNPNKRNVELLLLTKLHTVFEVFVETQDAVNSFFPDRKIKHFDILSFVQQQGDN